ncbi:MAG: quinone oxidoreductase [Granulosicoccus sp.]
MSEAIIIKEYGDSDVLVLDTVDVPHPDANELRIRQTAIGVNYHDVYVRSGLYKTLAIPGIPGCEATGVVEAIGSEVKGFNTGDRVAYVTGTYGAYATNRVLPADLAIRLPDDISDEIAASNLLRAMTVEMLTAQVLRIEPDMTILVHAAAGGVGRMLCQVASHIGATVIGTVGTAQKAEIARENGCEFPVLYRDTDFVKAVAQLTEGRGADAVFDSVGADTFAGSLNALAMCGHLVNFGQSSGPVDPLLMSALAVKSLTVSRPILFHYLVKPDQYQAMAQRVFEKFRAGILRAADPLPVALKDARQAHDKLEGMTGGGALILIP